MKLFIFLACAANGTADFVEVLAKTSAEAVRAVVAKHPGKRFNIVNVTSPRNDLAAEHAKAEGRA